MFKQYKWQKRAISALGIVFVGACGFTNPGQGHSATVPVPVRAAGPVSADTPERSPIKSAPLIVPADSEGIAVYRAAKRYQGAKIMVSTENRWLWFVVGKDTLLSVPVAIGTGKNFEFNGKKYKFSTPRGKRKVIKKEENPIWTVPAWHYYEKAAGRGLKFVEIKAGQIYPLADGTWIEVRDGEVGRVNKFGNFWPFTPGIEIIFDQKIFMPPLDTPQRRVPEALGPYKLDTGDGYLIHGTHIYNEDTIGLPASHGCVRMHNDDLELLYAMVETNTPVFIF
ncbi:MAG TPA: L,D-transpeptidase [Woeseiaceae bacterium]